MKKKQISISAVFRILLVGSLLFLIVFSLITQRVANTALIRQAHNASQSVLSVYVREMDAQAMDIERYLYQTLSSNSDLERMRRGSDELGVITAKQNLAGLFQQFLTLYPVASGVALIEPGGDSTQQMSSSYQTNYSDVLAINDYVQEIILLNSYPKSSWFAAQLAGPGNLLMRVIPFGDFFCCVWITMESINQSLSDYDIGEGSTTLLCSGDGSVLNRTGFENPVDFEKTSQGQFVQINQQMSMGNFRISALLPQESITKDLHSIRVVLFVLILLLLLVFPISFLLVKRSVYKPITQLIGAMEQAARGDLKSRAEEAGWAEFQTVNRYFNHMMGEIRGAKIEAYEIKLREQRVKRHFLQSQIKSHFYLNCINIIYMLAQNKDTQSIELLCLNLARYFRYLSANSDGLVPLWNEIAQVENYMEIQKFRYPGKIDCQIAVDGEEDDCQVPALMLLTFVENAVRYGQRDGAVTQIEIQVKTEGENCCIYIRDNGSGFPGELLRALNEASDDIALEGLDGVGIKNVKSRLSLLYQGRANITFANDQGAVVCIRLPKEKEDDQ